jgi:hypothetical protein
MRAEIPVGTSVIKSTIGKAAQAFYLSSCCLRRVPGQEKRLLAFLVAAGLG